MRGLDETALAAALDGLYAASFVQDDLPSAFHALAVAAGAEGCILVQIDAAGFGCSGSPGVAETVDAFAKGDWVERNYRFERGLALAEKGLLITESMLCTLAELDRQPLQSELLGRMGLRWWAGARIAKQEKAALFLSIERAARGERFDGSELATLRRILPHLNGAGANTLAIGRAFERGMMDGLEQVHRPAILLDGFARPIAMNHCASAVFPDLFCLVESRLRAACARSDADVQRALGALLGADRPHLASPPPQLRLRKRDGGSALARFTPVAGPLASTVKRPRILLTLQDGSVEREAKLAHLQRAYSLTPAEVQVALALADGHDVRAIAESQRVSLATVRSHLKAIFLKTDTNRQLEAALLVNRITEAVSG